MLVRVSSVCRAAYSITSSCSAERDPLHAASTRASSSPVHSRLSACMVSILCFTANAVSSSVVRGEFVVGATTSPSTSGPLQDLHCIASSSLSTNGDDSSSSFISRIQLVPTIDQPRDVTRGALRDSVLTARGVQRCFSFRWSCSFRLPYFSVTFCQLSRASHSRNVTLQQNVRRPCL